MTRRMGTILVVFVVMVVPGTALSYAQPSIPKYDIPTDIPADVRVQIEMLYSANVLERAWALRALTQMKAQAAPAISFLIAMLEDEARAILPKEAVSLPIGLRAAFALGSIGEPALEPVMQAVFSAEGPSVRERAAMAIRAMTNRLRGIGEHARISSVVLRLVKALKDDNATTRAKAAIAFRHINDARAVDPLIATLKDQNTEVRVEAVCALAACSRIGPHRELVGKPRGIEALIAALDDREPEVQRAAISGLRTITGYRFGEDPGIWHQWWEENQEEIQGYVWHQIGLLGSPLPDERASAIDELRELEAGAAPAVPFLMALLSDAARGGAGHHRVGWLAAMALTQIGAPALEPLMNAALYDDSPLVRENAVKALSRMSREVTTLNDPGIVQRLITALSDDNATIRAKAAKALGSFKCPSVYEALISSIEDAQPEVRISAVWAIGDGLATVSPGHIDKPHLIQPLIAALDHQETELQRAVRGVLKKLTGHYFEDCTGWQKWWDENRDKLLSGQ